MLKVGLRRLQELGSQFEHETLRIALAGRRSIVVVVQLEQLVEGVHLDDLVVACQTQRRAEGVALNQRLRSVRGE